MQTTIMKWVAVILLTGAVFWRPSSAYEIFLQFTVATSAILVMLQARDQRKYYLVVAFAAIGVLFNPIWPVILLSRDGSSWLALPCLLMFGISLGAMKTQPKLSIPSLTDRTPGSESL